MQANTPHVEVVHQGINHTEGGWPKDVSVTDPEQTTRYRRKLEKDEQFAAQILSVAGVSMSASTSPLLATSVHGVNKGVRGPPRSNCCRRILCFKVGLCFKVVHQI